MTINNKHKLKRMKKRLLPFATIAMMLFGAIVLPLGNASALSTTNMAVDNAELRYSSAYHDFNNVDKEKVFSIDCFMEVKAYPKFALDFERFEFITVANLNRMDSKESYTYAPNYAKGIAPNGSSFTESDYVVEGDITPRAPDNAPTCRDVFDEFFKDEPDWETNGKWWSDGNCVTGANLFIDQSRCTIIRQGYNNAGNKIFENGDVTFSSGAGGTVKINIPFMYAYTEGSDAFVNSTASRLRKEPKDEGGSVGWDKNPETAVVDYCYMDGPSDCKTVGFSKEIKVVRKEKGSGDPYEYILVLESAPNVNKTELLRDKQINLKVNICPPYVSGAARSAEFAVCQSFEKHGYASLLLSNTATKAALEALFAASTGAGQADCYESAGSLGFMSCETINSTENFVTNAYKTIVEDLLVVDLDTSVIGGAAGMMKAPANIFLAVILAIIIISQVTGFGISNYGVKTMLPRLLVYAVLVNMADWICEACIDIATIMSHFIEQIFGSSPGTSGGNVNDVTVILLTAVAGIAAISAVVNTSIVIPALIGIVGIAIGIIFLFVIIAVRQALIIFLVVVSPLAFMCNVLPNTRSIFQKWLGLFKGAVIAYPVVTAIVYGGAYAASLYGAQSGSGLAGVLHNMMAAAIAIAPVFMAPTILQGSIGAFNQLTGAAQRAITGRTKSGLGNRLPNSRLGSRIANRADRQKAERANRAAFQASRTQHGIDQKTMDKIGDKIAKGTATESEKNKYMLASQREASRARDNSAMAEHYVAGMTPADMQKWIRDNGKNTDGETMGAMQNAMMRKLSADGNTAAIENMSWDTSRMSQKDKQAFSAARASALKSSGDVIGSMAGKYNAANGTTFGDDFINNVSDSDLSDMLSKEGPDVLTKLASNPEAFDRFVSNLNAGGRQLEDVAPPEAMQHLMINSNKLSPQSLAHVQGALKRMSTPDASGNYSASYQKVMSNVSAKDLTGIHADILKDHLDNGMLDHAVTEYTVGNGQEYQGHTNEAQDNQIWKRSSTMGGGPSGP